MATDAPAVAALKQKYPDVPLPVAIVRPQTEQQVSSLVAYSNEAGISIAVRAGGHDFQGRSGPPGALVIDMRDMKEVEIVDYGHAAIIGGGVLAEDLAGVLAKTGHATAFGASNTVGWVGWATHGGYGPFEGVFGLGVDQLIEARMVDHEGRVLDADEDLLYGIRGAGSAFGVIVSLKIKIYRLKKVFAGVLIYHMGPEESMLADFLQRYQDLLDEGVPDELSLDVGVCKVPNAEKALFCSFLWASGDIVKGKAALEKMHNLGPIFMNTVAEMTVPAWLEAQSKATPPYGVFALGGPASIMVPAFDQEVRNVLVKYTTNLPPNPATLWVVHHIRGAALASKTNSSFAYREKHIMIEIIGTSVVEDLAEESGDWAVSFHADARRLKQTFEGGYIVLVAKGIEARKCFPTDIGRDCRL